MASPRKRLKEEILLRSLWIAPLTIEERQAIGLDHIMEVPPCLVVATQHTGAPLFDLYATTTPLVYPVCAWAEFRDTIGAPALLICKQWALEPLVPATWEGVRNYRGGDRVAGLICKELLKIKKPRKVATLLRGPRTAFNV